MVRPVRDDATRRVLLGCVERMAVDVARLRRRDLGGGFWIAERLASEVEVVDTCLWPSAGQLVAWTYPGDAGAVEAALEAVEGRQRHLWFLLGGRPRV